MTALATLIVPPMYQALIYGVHGVKVSARKVYLCGPMLETLESRTYKQADKIGEKDFPALIAFVRGHL